MAATPTNIFALSVSCPTRSFFSYFIIAFVDLALCMMYEWEDNFYPPFFLILPFHVIFNSSHIAIVDNGEKKKEKMNKSIE